MKSSFNKFEWSESDVTAGRIVCRAHRAPGRWNPDVWSAKWALKIGFVPADDPHYCLIAMTDGMICPRKLTKKQLAEKLTHDDMIPMPYGWWVRMVKWLQPQTNPK